MINSRGHRPTRGQSAPACCHPGRGAGGRSWHCRDPLETAADYDTSAEDADGGEGAAAAPVLEMAIAAKAMINSLQLEALASQWRRTSRGQLLLSRWLLLLRRRPLP